MKNKTLNNSNSELYTNLFKVGASSNIISILIFFLLFNHDDVLIIF